MVRASIALPPMHGLVYCATCGVTCIDAHGRDEVARVVAFVAGHGDAMRAAADSLEHRDRRLAFGRARRRA